MGYWAGVEGVEPSSQVLETRILPLNYTPRYRILSDMGAWGYKKPSNEGGLRVD